MISLMLKDTRTFMSNLLIKDTFDRMLLSEAVISTAHTYTINGEINKSFFSEEELSQLSSTTYAEWLSVKPFCYSLIRGSKVPTGMKIIFLLPDTYVSDVLSGADTILTESDINGLFLNIRYSDGNVTVVTGTSLRSFYLDKSVEHAFDKYVRLFFEQSGIAFEEQ